MFGRHLDDYLHGRRISWKVKAATLLVLGALIGCTAFLVVEALWLRVLLLVIAAGVTAHVVMLRGRRRQTPLC